MTRASLSQPSVANALPTLVGPAISVAPPAARAPVTLWLNRALIPVSASPELRGNAGMSRIGRLQRACRRAFLAASASELPTSALMAWARPRGAIQVWQREEVCRAAKRWAMRVRREGREWVWRLRGGQRLGEDEVAEGNIAQELSSRSRFGRRRKCLYGHF
jgi:hypothetical protein